jgi:hypothetical protein
MPMPLDSEAGIDQRGEKVRRVCIRRRGQGQVGAPKSWCGACCMEEDKQMITLTPRG